MNCGGIWNLLCHQRERAKMNVMTSFCSQAERTKRLSSCFGINDDDRLPYRHFP